MAILKGVVDFNFKEFRELAQQFPEFGGRLLSFVGARSRTQLKEKYFSGQEITLRKFPVDSLGRYTITSDVNKTRESVKIYSYPVNLFEKGRMLRNGRKEPAKRIIGTKLKQDVASRAATWSNEFEQEVIQKEIKKAGF